MARYADQTVTLVAGVNVPLPGVKVYVYDGNEALATLTEDGSGALANPVTSDAYGNFHFNTADGLYQLQFHYGGKLLYTQERVQVGTGPVLPDEIVDALAQPSAASIIGTRQEGEATRNVAAKLNDRLDLLDFYQPTDPDLTNAFEEALYRFDPTRAGVRLMCPPGRLTSHNQLIPARPFIIEGESRFGTTLVFHNVASVNATMKGAISVGTAATLTAYDPAVAGKNLAALSIAEGGSDFSSILNIGIEISGTKPSGFDYAVWTAARINVEDVVSVLCGYKVVAGALQSTSGTVIGNANVCQFRNVYAYAPVTHGFMTDGADANDGTFDSCISFVPSATFHGFLDYSLLGNYYSACNASGGSGSGATGYQAIGDSNRTIFNGCYCESDWPVPWDVCPTGTIINPLGTMPAALSSGRNKAFLGSQAASGFVATASLNVADSETIAATIGDSTHPASRLQKEGLRIMGSDGKLYEGLRGGGGFVWTRDGVAIMNFSAATGRPDFPNSITGTLPTYANNAAAVTGGLAVGTVYKVSTGEVRIVV